MLTEFRVLPSQYLAEDPAMMQDFKTLLLLREWQAIPEQETRNDVGWDW